MIDVAKKEKEALEKAYTTSISAKTRVDEILEVLSAIDPLTTFDEEVFVRIVESITITERTKLKFKFKVGIERDIIVDIK